MVVAHRTVNVHVCMGRTPKQHDPWSFAVFSEKRMAEQLRRLQMGLRPEMVSVLVLNCEERLGSLAALMTAQVMVVGTAHN